MVHFAYVNNHPGVLALFGLRCFDCPSQSRKAELDNRFAQHLTAQVGVVQSNPDKAVPAEKFTKGKAI
jgi:hypothetical protein